MDPTTQNNISSDELPSAQPVQEPVSQSLRFPWNRIAIISIAIIIVIVVGVGGILATKKTSQKHLVSYNLPTSASTPSVIPTLASPTKTLLAVPTTDSFTNWKTYQSTDVGILFKYPPNWITVPFMEDTTVDTATDINAHGIVQLSPSTDTNNPVIRIDYWNNPKQLSLTAFNKQFQSISVVGDGLIWSNLSTAQQITIAGKQGVFMMHSDDCDPYFCNRYLVPNNDRIIEIYQLLETNSHPTISDPGITRTLQQILTTFAFLNQTVTNNWKKYTNVSRKVSFSYPAAFSLQEQDNGAQQFIVTLQNLQEEFKVDIEPTQQFSNIMSQAKSTTVFNGITWGFVPASTYCDAGQCSGTSAEYVTAQNGYDYQFIISKQSTTSSANQILSTFQFTK